MRDLPALLLFLKSIRPQSELAPFSKLYFDTIDLESYRMDQMGKLLRRVEVCGNQFMHLKSEKVKSGGAQFLYLTILKLSLIMSQSPQSLCRSLKKLKSLGGKSKMSFLEKEQKFLESAHQKLIRDLEKNYSPTMFISSHACWGKLENTLSLE